MLDLEPGADLEEMERVPFRVVEKLGFERSEATPEPGVIQFMLTR